MKYNGELNELLLNIQRNITERISNNATVDKRHLAENIRSYEGNMTVKNSD